jgi:ATP-dependent protease ClpP protease subunit
MRLFIYRLVTTTRPYTHMRWHTRAEELLDRDHFKSADEAREFGLLDEVIAQRPAPPPDN